MVDIIPHAAGLLKDLGAQIEIGFRDTLTVLPLIALTMPSNVATTSGGVEVFTNITLQVDVFTADMDETFELVDKADAILTANGFTRTISQHFTEGDLQRQMMQFTCVVDYSHKRIII